MIKSRTDVATSLGNILTLRPTPSVLSAALSNNKNVLIFYVLGGAGYARLAASAATRMLLVVHVATAILLDNNIHT